MGKILLASLIAGACAGLAVYFVLAAQFQDAQRRTTDRIDAAEHAKKILSDQVDRLQTEVRAASAAARDAARSAAAAEEAARAVNAALARRAGGGAAEGAAPGGAGAEGGVPALVSPDGTPYISEKELEARLAKAGAGGAAFGAGAFPAPVAPKTLEEVAAEMSLSASEEARLRDVLRASEEEGFKALFGDRPVPEIVEEMKRAKDDPDLQEQLIGSMAGNVFQNLGKLATLEQRKKKRVEEVLGPERAQDFLRRPVKPQLGTDLESLFD